jgi:hypothetical protein
MKQRDLHVEAERIVGALVMKYGTKLPQDVQTTVSYYVSSRNGYDRAAENVLTLAGMIDTRDS